MICVDPDDLRIYGDFNTEKARQFNIQLKKCEGGTANNCKPDNEIIDYFRNKFLLVLTNQARFVSNGYEEARVKKESRLKWLQVNTQVSQTIPFKITSA
mmetsp:Transcript_47807/g.63164  ORF Transcript_47807/g.63164 Transcript_47807/m.63164 type:complete len:99 (+) Transcript_47807:496-792(+)|eukprot:CAMPEP_0185588514 /NCGR_PEP_ID=MMETSP0434-20130131/53422_1 /TAXON_ID=626734 ORGANISM="Favella taraikaensis, Strain Fe Narragansett Bay" /NCGR_SAMPLE_ID=MMETSP0434 /ASSEMBLY_ACC=CAM_ASM_000379 /LENGTH=98 /DNA_ID=CAMNT_0028211245 /DNA_START=475 /DNA_END=771 /DNA_ORIENTATION=+